LQILAQNWGGGLNHTAHPLFRRLWPKLWPSCRMLRQSLTFFESYRVISNYILTLIWQNKENNKRGWIFVSRRQCNDKNNTDVGSLYIIMKVMYKYRPHWLTRLLYRYK
jgi:hypothetical protein